MPKVINVTGLGPISFPDSMDDAAITHAIETDILPNNIGNIAQNRLSSRGLTPEAVKAGQGVTSPNQITFAPPSGSDPMMFWPNVIKKIPGVLSDVVQTPGKALFAPARSYAAGQAPTTKQGLDAATVGMVPDFTGTYNEASRRGAANISTQPMLEDTTAAATVASAGALAKPIANRLGASAESQYRSVVDPSGKNPLAPPVAQEMLDNRVITRNPRETIAQIAEAKAQAGDVKLNSAIKNMPNPVDATQVAAKIDDARAKLYNPQTGAPLQPDSDAIAAKLDTYSANHVLGNATAHIDPNGNLVFEMQPEVARALKQGFDKKPYGSGSETGTAEAQKAVGDSLRGELNKDPGVAAANKEISSALDVKNDVAPYAAKDTLPSAKRVLGAVGRSAIVEGMGAVFPPARMAGHVLAAGMGLASIPSIVIDVMRSPAWKTTSAVTKARLAAAIAAHDVSAVSEIAGGVGAGQQQ